MRLSSTSSAIETCRKRSTQPGEIPRAGRITLRYQEQPLGRKRERLLCGVAPRLPCGVGLAVAQGCRCAGSEGFLLLDALAFDYGVDKIHGKVLEDVFFSARPTHFRGVDHRLLPEAKMQTKVVLRKIAAPRAYFIELHDIARGHRHACPDGGLVTFCASQLEEYGVAGACGSIDEQCGRSADIENEDVDFAIVVHIPESCAPPGFQRKLVEAGERGDILECSVAMIAKQQHRLAVWYASLHQVHLRIDMAVGDE